METNKQENIYGDNIAGDKFSIIIQYAKLGIDDVLEELRFGSRVKKIGDFIFFKIDWKIKVKIIKRIELQKQIGYMLSGFCVIVFCISLFSGLYEYIIAIFANTATFSFPESLAFFIGFGILGLLLITLTVKTQENNIHNFLGLLNTPILNLHTGFFEFEDGKKIHISDLAISPIYQRLDSTNPMSLPFVKNDFIVFEKIALLNTTTIDPVAIVNYIDYEDFQKLSLFMNIIRYKLEFNTKK